MTTFLGSGIRAFLTGLLGWSLGEAFVIYADQFAEFGMYVVYGLGIIALLLLVAFFIRRKLKKRKVSSEK